MQEFSRKLPKSLFWKLVHLGVIGQKAFCPKNIKIKKELTNSGGRCSLSCK